MIANHRPGRKTRGTNLWVDLRVFAGAPRAAAVLLLLIPLGASSCGSPPVEEELSHLEEFLAVEEEQGHTKVIDGEEVDDPVEYGLETLESIRSQLPFESSVQRLRASLVLTLMITESRTAVLRAEAAWFLPEVLGDWVDGYEDRGESYSFEETTPHLQNLAAIGDEVASGPGSADLQAQDRESLDFVASIRPQGKAAPGVCRHVFGFLMMEALRRPAGEWRDGFVDRSVEFACHSAWIAYQAARADANREVRNAALCATLRLDANASLEAILQESFPLLAPVGPDQGAAPSLDDLGDPPGRGVERARILETLAANPVELNRLSPGLRRILVAVLLSRNTAVAFQARRAVASIVGLEETATAEELIRQLGVTGVLPPGGESGG